jgi:hypothetical protein
MKGLILFLILTCSGALLADVQANEKDESRWMGGFEYSVSTDLAESVSPRGYRHGINAEAGYSLFKNWNFTLGLEMGFNSYSGQIDKRQEEGVYETLGVNPSLGVQYGFPYESHWTFSSILIFPGDSVSRREGYQGIGILSAAYKHSLLSGRWTLTHSLTLMEILNSYSESTWGTANPGTSLSYKMSHSMQLYQRLNFIYIFGIKQTRYLDGFWDYSFTNIFGLAINTDSWNVMLSSNEGGFTDEGDIQFWFLDEYRRIVSLTLGYQF